MHTHTYTISNENILHTMHIYFWLTLS